MLTVGFIFGVILLQFLVGAVVSRYIKGGDDYFVAGRKQGNLMVTFSIFATWFGSESCLSTAGRVYQDGLGGARSDPFGYAVCLLIYGLFFVRKLWGDRVITIGDVIGKRFGASTETISAVVMAITSLLWAAAQVRAFGHVLAAHSEINLTLAIILATSVAVAYTAMGGLLADIYTDLIQGVFLIIGLVVLGFCVFLAVDSSEALLQVAPERFQVFSPKIPFLDHVDSWLVPIAGSIVAQELVSRISSAKNQKVAKSSTFMAMALYITVGFIPIYLGLMAPSLLGQVADHEQILIRLSQQYLPFSLNLLFSAALVSAILSTVDSALLASSAVLTRNLVGRFTTLNDVAQLKLGRFFVVIIGSIACYLGVASESAYELVVQASSFGTAGIFVLFLISLFTPWGSSLSGILTLLTGVFSTIILDHVYSVSASYVWSLIASVICFFLTEGCLRLKHRFFKLS